MRRYMITYLKNFDYLLFFTYVFLCLFGLVMIYSASMMVGIMQKGGTPDYFYNKQVLNLVIGALAFGVGAFFPYKHYSNKFVMYTAVGVVSYIFNLNPSLCGVYKMTFIPM